jgi:hypothetical protein
MTHLDMLEKIQEVYPDAAVCRLWDIGEKGSYHWSVIEDHTVSSCNILCADGCQGPREAIESAYKSIAKFVPLIEVDGEEECEPCKGRGVLGPSHSWRFCSKCKGTGTLIPAILRLENPESEVENG